MTLALDALQVPDDLLWVADRCTIVAHRSRVNGHGQPVPSVPVWGFRVGRVGPAGISARYIVMTEGDECLDEERAERHRIEWCCTNPPQQRQLERLALFVLFAVHAPIPAWLRPWYLRPEPLSWYRFMERRGTPVDD